MPIDALYEAIRNAPKQTGQQPSPAQSAQPQAASSFLQAAAAAHPTVQPEAPAPTAEPATPADLWNGYDYNAEAERRAQVGGYTPAPEAFRAPTEFAPRTEYDPQEQARKMSQAWQPSGGIEVSGNNRAAYIPGTQIEYGTERGDAYLALAAQRDSVDKAAEPFNPFKAMTAAGDARGALQVGAPAAKTYNALNDASRAIEAEQGRINEFLNDEEYRADKAATAAAIAAQQRRENLDPTEAAWQLDQLKRQYEETKRIFASTNPDDLIVDTSEKLGRRDKILDDLAAQIAQLEADLTARQNETRYAQLMRLPDFEQNSQYIPHERIETDAIKDPSREGIYADRDVLYEAVNGNQTAVNQYNRMTGNSGNYDGLAYMTDDERKIYNYLYARDMQSEDSFARDDPETHGESGKYLKEILPTLNARMRADAESRIRAEAKEHPFAMSVASVLTSPLKAASYASQLGEYAATGKIDPNAAGSAYSYMNNAVRSTVSREIERKWGKTNSFAYNTGMSFADSLYQMLLTGGPAGEGAMLVLMGMESAADTVIAAKERGLTDAQAFALGTATGAIEALTEKIGFDNLYNVALRGDTAALKALLSQALAEGSEEFAGSVLDNLADMIIAGTDSEHYRRVRALVASGMSETEAIRKAWGEDFGEAGMEALSGALSGMLMSGGGRAIMSAFNAAPQVIQNIRDAREQNRVDEMVRMANEEAAQRYAGRTQAATPSTAQDVSATAPFAPQEGSNATSNESAAQGNTARQSEDPFTAAVIASQSAQLTDSRSEFTQQDVNPNTVANPQRQEYNNAINETDRQGGAPENDTLDTGTDTGTQRSGSNDEFRTIQERSRAELDQSGWPERSGAAYDGIRQSLPRVLQGELERRGYNAGSGNARVLTAKGGNTITAVPVDGNTFHDIFETARPYVRKGELVDLHPVISNEDSVGYDNCECWLSADGTAGFAITPDGDLISVYNLGTTSGWLSAIAPIVREQAKTLDCYAPDAQNLPEMYSRFFGFKTASVMDYNAEYDHDGIMAAYGSPKIAFMVNTDADVETRRFGKDDYDAAKAWQEECAKSSPATRTVGAAETGYNYADAPREQKVSRQYYTTQTYSRPDTAEASGRPMEAYRKALTYETRSIEEAQDRAAEALYYMQDGKETFVGQIDPDGLNDVMNDLAEAKAWNDVQTAQAQMILAELRREAAKEQTAEKRAQFNQWLDVVQKHVREGARGMRMNREFSYSRDANRDGIITEQAAIERVNSNDKLSDAEKQALIDEIMEYDERITDTDDKAELIDIIMEIAEERKTVSHGATGIFARTIRSTLNTMSIETLKQAAYASSAMLSEDAQKVDFWRKVKTIQVLNMLSNPKTTVTNVTSNLGMLLLDVQSMRLASLIDMTVSLRTKTRSIAAEKGLTALLSREGREIVWQRLAESIAEVGLDINLGGGGKYFQGTQTFKADGRGAFGTNKATDQFAERILHAFERNMNYALRTPDELFKGLSRASSQGGLQRLQDEGRIRTENENYAEDTARDLELYRTFQNQRLISDVIVKLHDVLNLITPANAIRKMTHQELKQAAFGLGDIAAPFAKIAANLVGVAVDYNPVTAVKGLVQTIDILAKGENATAEQQRRAVSNLSRGLTGTALTIAAMFLARLGLIRRASDEDDKSVASLNRTEGMTGTQINLSAAKRGISGGSIDWQQGDMLIDLSRFEPINFLVDLGATLVANDAADADFITRVGQAAKSELESFGNASGDLPVLQSVGNFVEDVTSYGTPWYKALADTAGKTAVSSLTPNVIAALAKGIDPYQRNLYTRDNYDPKTDTLIDALMATLGMLGDTTMSRIPGLREMLPTKTDTTGNAAPNPGTLTQRLLNAMILPWGVNTYAQTETSKELERLREATGRTDFYPRVRNTTKSVQQDKVTYTFDYEERQEFQRLYSEAYWKDVNALVKTARYKNMDDAQKADALKSIGDDAYDTAKSVMIQRKRAS